MESTYVDAKCQNKSFTFIAKLSTLLKYFEGLRHRISFKKAYQIFQVVLIKSNSIKSQMAYVLTIICTLKCCNKIIEQKDQGLRICWININHISVLKIERPLPWSIDADGLVHM